METNAAIEIHDSTLERIERGGVDVIAIVDAYVHRSAGQPGVDRGTGWKQPVRLRFLAGTANGSVNDVPMELLGGRLVLSEGTFSNMIPMPLNHVGPSRIELESWNDVGIVIDGNGVEGAFVGPPVYVEEFEP